MGNGCLTEEQIKELIRILDKILTEHFNRYAARQGNRVCGNTINTIVLLHFQFLMNFLFAFLVHSNVVIQFD